MSDIKIFKKALENVLFNKIELSNLKLIIKDVASGKSSDRLGDHMPSRLFEGVYKLPSIKILFRTDKEDLQKFGLDVEDIMVIDSLKNRFAFIKDGVNSRRFVFYTTDYER